MTRNRSQPRRSRRPADVSLGAFAIDAATVAVSEGMLRPDIEVRVTLAVRDIETREPNTVTHRLLMPRIRWDALPADMRAEAIRREVMKAIEHEVDEWLTVDGERVRDPHPVRGAEASETVVHEGTIPERLRGGP